MGHRGVAAFAASVAIALAFACGSSSNGSSGGPGDDGGSSGTSGSSGFGGDGSSGSSGDLDSGLNACATDTQQAHLEPLSLMLMQDTSGSMWELTSGTTSKWDAVQSALGTFMSDPASAGIGLGIQFFPLYDNGVPNSCAVTADCGATGGVCRTGTCTKTGAPCNANADCPGGGNTCAPDMRCHLDAEYQCVGAAQCVVGPPPTSIGPCDRPLVRGVCWNTQIVGGVGVSCTTTDYATPAAAIAPLPGAAAAITGALAAHIPNGQTPTYNALEGAIQAAQAYATAHPGEVVAVVLSTDGTPYTGNPPKCDDNVADIEAVAAAGLAATPSIKTFVIGVLSPQDKTAQATATLNGIAAAGGTGSATILGTSGTTEADFIAALGNIRGASLPCEFTLPVPEAGTPDYQKVNVVYTSSTTMKDNVFGYVGAQANCDPAKGGWYYDADPAMGGTPTKVILCPASCGAAQGDPAGKVAILQGCATVTQPPPH
jgi:hypothetical protein